MADVLPAQLETARLLIRAARPGDGAVFNEAVVESIDQLAPWLAWATPPPSVADSEKACVEAFERFEKNEDLMVFFFLREGGQLIGGGGLHDADWELRHFEIGYWGRTRFAGAGLMTEGVNALANHALLQLAASRVVIFCDDRNTASWRTAERAGFQLEGILRNERRDVQGGLRNTRVYSRIPG